MIQVLCSILAAEGEESKRLDDGVALHFNTLDISLQQGAGKRYIVAMCRLVRIDLNVFPPDRVKYRSKLL